MNIEFVKPARDVSRVFLHCSASGRPEHDDVSVIREWHLERGWSDVGYHFFIRSDGLIQEGRPLEKIPAAQGGHNTGTIAICLHGLVSSDFSLGQFNSLQNLCHQINRAYDDAITFHGHCEVSDKDCPVFNYKHVLALSEQGYLTKVSRVGPYQLKLFDRGVDVAQLQVALNLEYSEKMIKSLFPLVVDGMFGASTQRAVIKFQQDHNLEPDGVVGPRTRLVLPSRPGI